MRSGGAALNTHKRWRLRPGATIDDVVALTAELVVPHYRLLSAEVELGLQQLDETTVLAVQRWTSRHARDDAMQGPAFDEWWSAYLPTLAAWDDMVEFVDEWEGEDLLA